VFERPSSGERAVLVQLAVGGDLPADARDELQDLAEAAGATVAGVLGGSRASPDPKYFIGTGKAGELKELVAASEADLVIVDHALSPAQERNLERLLECRVVDRSGLILDIFARHIQDVETVLAEIGADEVPRIMVYNKIDTLTEPPGGAAESVLPRVDRDASGRVERVWLSAVTGAGIDLLMMAIAELLQTANVRQRLLLGPEDGAVRAWLFRHATVEHDSPTELGGWELEISIPQARWQRLQGSDDAISRRICTLAGPVQAPVPGKHLSDQRAAAPTR